jgi:hypothetical protein
MGLLRLFGARAVFGWIVLGRRLGRCVSGALAQVIFLGPDAPGGAVELISNLRVQISEVNIEIVAGIVSRR